MSMFEDETAKLGAFAANSALAGGTPLNQASQSLSSNFTALALQAGLNSASNMNAAGLVGPGNTFNMLQKSLSSLTLPPINTTGGIKLASAELGAGLGALVGAALSGTTEAVSAGLNAAASGGDVLSASLKGAQAGAAKGLVDGAAAGANIGMDLGADIASYAKAKGFVSI